MSLCTPTRPTSGGRKPAFFEKPETARAGCGPDGARGWKAICLSSFQFLFFLLLCFWQTRDKCLASAHRFSPGDFCIGTGCVVYFISCCHLSRFPRGYSPLSCWIIFPQTGKNIALLSVSIERFIYKEREFLCIFFKEMFSNRVPPSRTAFRYQSSHFFSHSNVYLRAFFRLSSFDWKCSSVFSHCVLRWCRHLNSVVMMRGSRCTR